MKTAIVVLTLNAGEHWAQWIAALQAQSIAVDEVLVIDSSSTDDTVALAEKAGFNVRVIERSAFNHGATRQAAADLLNESDVIIYFTQDAILSGEHAIKNSLLPFSDDDVAAVCGRQLPKQDANEIAAHARRFNYPESSSVRQLTDRKKMGIKTAFLSNSFAAYRVSALREVGGFPHNVIFGEDMYVASKLLLAGKKIAYAADACVLHSHNYSMIEEFKRYFDIGVFHARQPWIKHEFGASEKEGSRMIRSELSYLLKNACWHIPEALLRSLLKYTGFRLGRIEILLPYRVKLMCSMNPAFFKRETAAC